MFLRQLEDLRKTSREMQEKLIECSQNISLKADSHEIDTMKKLLDALPRLEDMDAQRKYLETNVQKFQEDNDHFHDGFREHNEIIRRYDEVLNQKCSKIALEKQNNDLVEMIRKLNGDTRTLATDIKESMQADIARLFETQQSYDDKLSDAIERKFKRERLKHGQQAPETDALAQDGGANLKRVLIMKADKVDLEKLYEIKSNKVDTDNMLDIQSLMQK